MTAVIRPADALLKASIMISSSMTERFTGEQIGWTMKTSRERTFSRMRTKTFSFENSNTSASPIGISSARQIETASSGCALPLKMARSEYTSFSMFTRRVLSVGRHLRPTRNDNTAVHGGAVPADVRRTDRSRCEWRLLAAPCVTYVTISYDSVALERLH